MSYKIRLADAVQDQGSLAYAAKFEFSVTMRSAVYMMNSFSRKRIIEKLPILQMISTTKPK